MHERVPCYRILPAVKKFCESFSLLWSEQRRRLNATPTSYLTHPTTAAQLGEKGRGGAARRYNIHPTRDFHAALRHGRAICCSLPPRCVSFAGPVSISICLREKYQVFKIHNSFATHVATRKSSRVGASTSNRESQRSCGVPGARNRTYITAISLAAALPTPRPRPIHVTMATSVGLPSPPKALLISFLLANPPKLQLPTPQLAADAASSSGAAGATTSSAVSAASAAACAAFFALILAAQPPIPVATVSVTVVSNLSADPSNDLASTPGCHSSTAYSTHVCQRWSVGDGLVGGKAWSCRR